MSTYSAAPFTGLRGGGSGYFLQPGYVPTPKQLKDKQEWLVDAPAREALAQERQNLLDQEEKEKNRTKGRASTLLTSGFGLLDEAPSARRILLGA